MKTRRFFRLSLLPLAILVTVSNAGVPSRRQLSSPPGQLPQALLRQPLLFEQNQGQTHPEAKFLARSAGGVTYFFTESGVTMRLSKLSRNHQTAATSGTVLKSHALKISFIDANPHPVITAELPANAVTNYFLGSREQWRSRVRNHYKIRYHNVYDGIDLVYYGNGRQLEYDFIVHPGADPNVIRIKYDGANEALRLAPDGGVAIATSVGLMHEMKPYVYQTAPHDISNRKEIAAGWRTNGKDELQFALGDYDGTQILYLDPLLFSTFLGSSADEIGTQIALDEDGSIYIAGQATSQNYPTTTGVLDSTFNGSFWDVVVTKLNANASALQFSTFLGGNSSDSCRALAVDAEGAIYLTGATQSNNFPTTLGAYDGIFAGISDVYVAKLNATGTALIYSTYLGQSGNDAAYGLALDGEGNAWITGQTNSSNFPTIEGAYDATHNGGFDAFVTGLNATATALAYSTFLGGSGHDIGRNIVRDAGGNLFIAGETGSSLDYPVAGGAFDLTYNGGNRDLFVAKMNGTASALTFSTFLGGSGEENENVGLSLDGEGNIFVAGRTSSSNFPTTASAVDTSFNGGADAFVSKLNPAGSALLYSTFLGGSGSDAGMELAVTNDGYAYLGGYSSSSNFPATAWAYDVSFNGNGVGTPSGDAFVAKLNPAGTKLFYSTFLGGSNDDILHAIAIDDSGDAYVTGYTTSSNYPTKNAFDASYNSGSSYGDIFVTKLNITDPPPPPIYVFTNNVENVDNAFWVYIKVGDNIMPVSNLFGVSFVLNFDNTIYVDVVEPVLQSVQPGFKMGPQAVFYSSVNEADGQLQVGVSQRRGQPGVSGTGITVAKMLLAARSPIPNGTQINFTLNTIKANDADGMSMVLKPRGGKITMNYDNSPVLVWPGDTDNSGAVNEADVLPLGLHWGRTGPVRPEATMRWFAQTSSTWTPRPATHADADGDGEVEQGDVLPIGVNWGRTHGLLPGLAHKEGEDENALQSVSRIQPETNAATLSPGEEFVIRIKVTEVSELFGLSFKLFYDQPALLQILSVEPNSWMGSDVVFFSTTDAAAGNVSVGITRKAGQGGVNGTGVAVRVRAKIVAQTPAGTTINFSLQNVAANNPAGVSLRLNPQTMSIAVGGATGVDSEREGALPLAYRLEPNHPNPFHGVTSLRYQIPQAGLVTVKIFNSTGQEVRTVVKTFQQPGFYHFGWDGKDEQGRAMPSGVYLYRLQAGAFVQGYKMVMLHR